jgi:hypothetical protein
MTTFKIKIYNSLFVPSSIDDFALRNLGDGGKGGLVDGATTGASGAFTVGGPYNINIARIECQKILQ